MLRVLRCRRFRKRERVVLGIGGKEDCTTLCSQGSANRCPYSPQAASSRHDRYFAAQIRELHTATYPLSIPEKQNHPARILEKQNSLQMSQVFPFPCIGDQMGLAFQGFYKRDRKKTDKATTFPDQLYMHAQIKKPTAARCARGLPGPLTLNKFRSRCERGRFTPTDAAPTRPCYPYITPV